MKNARTKWKGLTQALSLAAGEKLKFDEEVKILAASWIALIPAILFWVSMIVYVGMGTDYVIDVVVAEMEKSIWGNILLITLVIGMPLLISAANGWKYKLTRRTGYRDTVIIGIVLVIMGVVTIIRGI